MHLAVLLGAALAADGGAVKQPIDAEALKASLNDANAAEIDLARFLELKRAGPVVVLDVRSKESFARRHVKGAVNVPLTELTETTLPKAVPGKDTPVVLMCEYSFAPVRMISMTYQAYPVLKLNGYSRIFRATLWQGAGGKYFNDSELRKALEFEGTDIK